MTFYLWFMGLWGLGRHNDLSWQIFDQMWRRWAGDNYNRWLVEVRDTF